MLRFWILFSFIFTYITCDSQIIQGKVLGENNTPIENALVVAVDYEISTRTTKMGEFSFSSEFKQVVKIKISAIGYETFLGTVNPTENQTIVTLNKSHIDIEEVVVVSNYKGLLQKNNVTHIEVRKIAELKSIPTINLGEALATIPGVYQTSTGNGISKPVIRGLQGTRVVTLLNGLRIENQQWGGDHGMGVSELGIGSVEVIKGPASVLYGADALGGVLYLIDEPFAKQNHHEINASTQFSSNTVGTNNQLSYKISKKNWRLSTAGLYANHADFQLPNSRYAQNSRFNEQAGKLNFSYHKGNWILNVKYNFQANRAGIPGHTHDTIINPLSFQVSEQRRSKTIPAQVISNHFLWVENKFFLKRNEISLGTGYTSNRLTEFDEKVTIPGIDMHLSNLVFNGKVKYNWTEKLDLIYGVQSMFQSNVNGSKASETLLPNATTFDVGAFVLGTYSHKKWNVQVGGRGDVREIKSLEPFKGNAEITKTFPSLNGSIGVVRNSQKTTFRLNYSSGFRAPHLTELLANGFHHGALRYEIGNRNLKAERANQLDATFQFHHEHIEISVNPFVNLFNNFIYIDPMDTIIDGLPAFEYKQMNQAQLIGTDVGFHYHPHFAHWIHIENNVSYIIAEGNNGIMLPFIPQTRINTTLRFVVRMKSKFKLEEFTAQSSANLAQNRVSSYETRSPFYHLIHLGAQFKYASKQPISLQIGVRNLLNENYIDHLSRLKNIEMPHPGFNLFVGLKIHLEYQTKQK